MKVVILGKGLMLSNIILGSLDAGAEIVGVFRYDYTVNNKFKLAITDFFSTDKELQLIKKHKIKQLKFKSANSEVFKNFLIRENVDLVIVGTWRERIKKEVYDIPKIATVNFHPSLLPKYRGPNPYLQTILHGEKFTGVTLHLLDKNYDTGAILLQEKFPILDSDTSKELRERTVVFARKMVADFINNYSNLIPQAQNEEEATYFKNISGDEKMIDFTTQTSYEIYRTVKALHPFLPCYITLCRKFYIINPYRMKIINKIYEDNEPNDIIEKSANNQYMAIVCKDKRVIQFNELRLYK